MISDMDRAQREAKAKAARKGHKLGPFVQTAGQVVATCHFCKKCKVMIPKHRPKSHWGSAYVFRCGEQEFRDIPGG